MKILNLPIIGIKKEYQHYTPATLGQDDYCYLVNNDLSIDPNIENYTRKLLTTDYTKYHSVSGKRSCAINFSVDAFFYASITKPKYFDLLTSCGWFIIDKNDEKFVIDTSSDDVFSLETKDADEFSIYNFITKYEIQHGQKVINSSPCTFEACYFEENITPRQHIYKISGAMGYTNLSGTVGMPLKQNFSFLGALESIRTKSYVDALLPANCDEETPYPILDATATFFGTELSIVNFEIMCGDILNLFSDIQRHNGWNGARISDSFATGELILNPEHDFTIDIINKISMQEKGMCYIKYNNVILLLTGVQIVGFDENLTKIYFNILDNIIIGQYMAGT